MAQKDTKNKPRLSYIPYSSLVKIAEVRQFGIDKYGENKYDEVNVEDFLDAALRHIFKHIEGEYIDNESGRSHLAHAATSLILAMHNHERNNNV